MPRIDLEELVDENRRLRELMARMNEDLAQARAFQQRILPALPRTPEAHFAVIYRPAEEVGGDLYDIHRTTGGGFRVFIVDAIGHGMQAALRTMILKAEWDRVRDAATPVRALVELNRRLVAAFPGLELQCTASCVDVTPDGERAQVAYATAAHPPLVIGSPSGARQVYKAGPFLGVLPDVELDEVYFNLPRGDRLFLFTDGLVEETRGQEEFGMTRVLAALGRRAALDATLAAVAAEVDEFVGGAEPVDDLTLIGLEIG
jgi:serine phosphatase RsbU (regulator of sigma subunit)